jgi:hypothetical protein
MHHNSFRNYCMHLFSVADPEFHSGLDTGSLDSPNRDQRDWERGKDQWDGRSTKISETRQASRRLTSSEDASKFVIPVNKLADPLTPADRSAMRFRFWAEFFHPTSGLIWVQSQAQSANTIKLLKNIRIQVQTLAWP